VSFIPPIGAATSTNRGLIKLTGDLAGTADSPTVPDLSLKANTTDVYGKSEVDSALAGKADASALSGYVATSQVGAANGVASLDSGGKLPSAQLNVTFPVTSVASQTGDVALTKSDVGLANVDNTSDVNKPVSSATQTALDGKAALSHTHTASQISDATAVGQGVMTASDQAAAQLALGIANTVQVVDSFASVTSPVYGTLYVVRT